MAWEVEYSSEFGDWWETLGEEEQIEISAKVELLEKHGPVLLRPHADVIVMSKHSNMKELRGRAIFVAIVPSCAFCMHSILAEPPFF